MRGWSAFELVCVSFAYPRPIWLKASPVDLRLCTALLCVGAAMPYRQFKGEQPAAMLYRLAYHNGPSAVPGRRFGGRMEPVRMMLEDAGVAYEDVVLDYTQIVVSTGPKLDSGFSSNFAPPLVQKINEIGEVVFQISQLSAVLEYLAEDLGVFLPADIQQRGYARQVANDLADFGSDGFAPFHARTSMQATPSRRTSQK